MLIPILVFVVSVLTTLFFIRPLKKLLYRVGIRAIDQQKKEKPKLPTSSGLIVMVGFLAGIFAFVGINTFAIHMPVELTYIFAGSFSIMIITLIGFFDDINVAPIMKKDKGIKDFRIGLKQWHKALLVLPAAVPLMAVKAGTSTMFIPFVGIINLGILYPLILIPIAVVCVTNATNMLAGMNGLEAGLGLVSTAFLGLFSLYFGSTEGAVIAFSAAGALLVLLAWNKYPAKILPGDSLTYLIGAVIVSTVVITNMEKIGIIIFTPWIIEALLKLRSKFQARSLGNLQKDGTLEPPYKKIYSWTHLMMKIGINRERKITLNLILIEIILCSLTFITLYLTRTI